MPLDGTNDRAGFCAQLGWAPNSAGHTRRIFLGMIIADEPLDVLDLLAAESKGLIDTVSFVEANMTQMRVPRTLRFAPGLRARKHLDTLFEYAGARVVSWRSYVPSRKYHRREGALALEMRWRLQLTRQWQAAGMRPDDIAIVQDPDETFSRGFLRALRECDVPAFRPGTCQKIVARTFIFERYFNCVWRTRRWFHPDAISGRCLRGIAPSIRPKDDDDPDPQQIYQRGGRSEGCKAARAGSEQDEACHLWRPGDLRWRVGSSRYQLPRHMQANAFHFHNFYSDAQLRFKYKTYGHPVRSSIVDAGDPAKVHADWGMADMCRRGDPANSTAHGGVDLGVYAHKTVESLRSSNALAPLPQLLADGATRDEIRSLRDGHQALEPGVWDRFAGRTDGDA